MMMCLGGYGIILELISKLKLLNNFVFAKRSWILTFQNFNFGWIENYLDR
jgi:hypothetical protein